jgi:uncharacterized membrane protein
MTADPYQAAVGALRFSLLLFGTAVISVGIARAVFEARGPGGAGRVARRMTEHVALGLEFFVGATILNLILNPTWTAVASTALTIVIRKLATYSLGAAARAA